MGRKKRKKKGVRCRELGERIKKGRPDFGAERKGLVLQDICLAVVCRLEL